MNRPQERIASVEAEQAIIGNLIRDNDAIDRITDLRTEHFYMAEHRTIFAEILKQITAGKTCDVISLFDALGDRLEDCLRYLNELVSSAVSSAGIRRHADIVTDRALKRALIAIGSELQEIAAASHEDSMTIIDRVAAQIEELGKKKTQKMPRRLSETLADYMDVLDARMKGRIKPIATGFTDLDSRLDGGLERGTLTVLAARPGMGKTAMGLALCRNVSIWGGACFLSMEMDERQVNDRNMAALGGTSIPWLRKPKEDDKDGWNRITHGCQRATAMEFYVDDQTSLNMMEIRNKARYVKRKAGMDLLVIDQLSFITGGGSSNKREVKTYEIIGEYTRGLIALAKQLDIAVVLLCQLNRDCENRPNKRPQLSDLAMSGSIEQDAANVVFLYRDEIYHPDSQDNGICEVITAKQRQGSPGIVALAYIANQTRFEDLGRQWQPQSEKPKAKIRSLS